MEQKSLLISKAGLSSLLTVLLLILMVNNGDLFAQARNRPRSPTGLYLRAPDTIPGTTFEMRDPSYWIDRMEKPDEVVMTLEEIQARNSAYVQRMKNYNQLDIDSSLRIQINRELSSRPGLLASLPDLNTMTPDEISALTTGMIEKELTMLKNIFPAKLKKIKNVI